MTDCIFCKIVAGQIPATVVYEDDLVFAFRDIKPVAPVHVLVIPKRHICSLQETDSSDQDLLGALLAAARQIAQAEGLTNGYRVVTNIGDDGGQVVKHLHFHVIGGKPLAELPSLG